MQAHRNFAFSHILVRQPSLFFVSLTTKIKSFVTTPFVLAVNPLKTLNICQKIRVFTMSDQISQLDLHKMQHQVKVCEADFRYAARSNDRGIACAIKIPYPLFIIWRNLKRDECAMIQTDIIC